MIEQEQARLHVSQNVINQQQLSIQRESALQFQDQFQVQINSQMIRKPQQILIISSRPPINAKKHLIIMFFFCLICIRSIITDFSYDGTDNLYHKIDSIGNIQKDITQIQKNIAQNKKQLNLALPLKRQEENIIQYQQPIKQQLKKQVFSKTPLHHITIQQLKNAVQLLKLNNEPHLVQNKDADKSKINFPEQRSKHFLRQKQDKQQAQHLMDMEFMYYQSKYKISKVKQQIQFCVLVPSHNNANFYQRNLNSIFNQEYTNFKIIYIDDASTDQTPQYVSQYIKSWSSVNSQIQRNFILVQNKQNFGRVKNVYENSHKYCQKSQVMMVIDGDDQLIGRQVFQLLNVFYQTKDVKVLYTQSLILRGHTSQVGHSLPYSQNIIKYNNFRNQNFICSHLRTYLTDLYFKINENDLKDSDGNWIKYAGDVAEMFPILQMAHPKIMYLNEIVYRYNDITQQNDHFLNVQSQQQIQKYIRKKQKYEANSDILKNANNNFLKKIRNQQPEDKKQA